MFRNLRIRALIRICRRGTKRHIHDAAASTMSGQKENAATPTETASRPETEVASLPKLSAAEFKQYNRMAEHMDHFHNMFRQTWTIMSTACDANRRPDGMSIRQFLRMGLDFCSHLTMHHSIEETYIFPKLAARMPEFRAELELLEQHKHIHAGLDQLQDYLVECQNGERELRLDKMRELMRAFGDVLWTHLDQEVQALGAENVRKYWSLEEMDIIAF